MSNEYTDAQAIELGRAGDLLLGNKYVGDIDSNTGLFGTRVMDDLEETGNGRSQWKRRKTHDEPLRISGGSRAWKGTRHSSWQ